MPYSGIGDTSLPSTVRKMPKKLRQIWVRVFNDNYDPKDEGKAFKLAYGAVRAAQNRAKKERGMGKVVEPVWTDPPGGKTAPVGEKAVEEPVGGDAIGLEVIPPAAEEKAIDLDDWQMAVRDAMRAALPMMWAREVYDAFVIAVEQPPHPEQTIHYDESPAMVETIPAVAPVPATTEPVTVGGPEGEQGYKLWKVPYTTTQRATDGSDVSIIETVTFAPQAEWVRVIEGFTEFKTLDDGKRWLAVSSGGFEDRDGEIVSTAFLESCVALADKTKDRGPLLIWHTPGSAIGTCDFQAVVGDPGLLLESGTFDDTPDGRSAVEYYKEHAKEKGMSIKFFYLNRTEEGTYLPPGIIMERSILPLGRAAFPWSGINLEEMAKMAKIDSAKLQELSAIIGEARANEIVEHLDEQGQVLKEIGIRFKEQQAETPAKTTPTETPATAQVEEKVEKTPVEPEPEEVELQDGFSFELSPEAIEAVAKQVGDGLEERLLTPMKEFGQRLETLHAAVNQLSADVDSMRKQDDDRLAEKAANMPRATIRRLQRPSQETPVPAEKQVQGVDYEAVAKKTLYG